MSGSEVAHVGDPLLGKKGGKAFELLPVEAKGGRRELPGPGVEQEAGHMLRNQVGGGSVSLPGIRGPFDGTGQRGR
jgi:hypothetical protein